MPTSKTGRYHHGDLRAALIGTAVDLIAERGVRAFSMAEASRHLGVSVSAPYAHFTDRDDLLAAVAVHAYERFIAELQPGLAGRHTPAERLAAVSDAYVRFAGLHRALFEVLFGLGLDKKNHPEIDAAKQPIVDILLNNVDAVDDIPSEVLAVAVEAVSHGYAMMLLDGDFGSGPAGIEQAASGAARATLAVIEGRRLLG